MWQEKRWLVAQADSRQVKKIAAGDNISPLIGQILVQRGIISPAAAEEFLFGKKQPFYAPQLLKGMPEAVARICQALKKQEKITVYGDYDVDGITASSLLKLFFQQLGTLVDVYIPVRETEGYGLNSTALANIAQNGTTLLITVDCGISSVQEVAEAPAELDIIITDHHSPPENLPSALAVVNPKQAGCPYPYKELAGVGLAFKLCQALWHALENPAEFFTGQLDLVALGTVADIVPLTGENREIVKLGLKTLQEKNSPGLNALLKVSGIAEKKITAGHLGFMLGPRLNAAGRLTSAQKAVELLTTPDAKRAEEIAGFLDRENQTRQQIERQIFLQAEELVAGKERLPGVLVLAREGWHAGIIGIVASRLVEKYNRPVVMISVGEEECKGSCRSIPAFDIYAALCFAKDCLLKFGGHRQAAGLTVQKEQLKNLELSLNEYARLHLTAEDYLPVQRIDAILEDFTQLDEQLLLELSQLEPYGMCNPAPVLAAKNVMLTNLAKLGADGKHLKFSAEKSGRAFTSLMWRRSDLLTSLYENILVDLAFCPEENVWRNLKSINLRVLDLQKNQMLLDFRYEEKLDKLTCLKGILQNQQKLGLYFLDQQSRADILSFFSADLLAGIKPLGECENLVFYQPPYLLLEKGKYWQQLRKNQLKKVYLLYNKEDVADLTAALDEQNPGIFYLRELYKFIRSEKSASLAKLAIFDASAKLPLALEILTEIKAVQKNGPSYELCELVPGQKLELESSLLYQKISAMQEKKKAALQKCLKLSKREFSAMLFS